jgi:hypothetical protein
MGTRRIRGLRTLAGSLLSLAILVPATAAAHTGGESHRAIVSVEPDAIRTLLMMQVPAGRRASGLLARFDFDRSGDLNALEGQLLAAHLGAELVGGWLLKLGETAPVPKNIDARAAVSEGGGLLIALLLEYPPATAAQRVGVQVLATPGGRSPVKARAVVVEVQSSAGVSQSSHPVARDAPVMGPIVLQPGGEGAWLRAKSTP